MAEATPVGAVPHEILPTTYMKKNDISQHLKEHWFFLAIPFLILVCIGANYLAWMNAASAAIATIVCLTVVLPLLFIACYWHFPLAKKLLRSILLVFFGLWVANKVIPADTNMFNEQMAWIGYLKWPVIIYLETKSLALVFSLIFKYKRSANETMDALVAQNGLPPWVARVGKLEIAAWQALWGVVLRLKRGALLLLRIGHSSKR